MKLYGRIPERAELQLADCKPQSGNRHLPESACSSGLVSRVGH